MEEEERDEALSGGDQTLTGTAVSKFGKPERDQFGTLSFRDLPSLDPQAPSFLQGTLLPFSFTRAVP